MKYNIIVKPGSKKGPLIEESIEGLTVYLRERPVEGAANQVLIKLLAKHFGVGKTQIIIKTGATSRHKIIEVLD